MEEEELKLNFEGFMATPPIAVSLLSSTIPNFRRAPVDPKKCRLPEMASNLLLGKRAERFFAAYIEASTAYEMVAENLQIIDGKQTLGELDFIVRRLANDQLIHVELVYKFYLYDASISGSEYDRWVGPNRNDSLALKCAKLEQKQFPILRSSAAMNVLSTSLGIDARTIAQEIAFFANLFLPFNRAVSHKLNPACIVGFWYHLLEFLEAHQEDDCYFIPEKSNWFMRSVPPVNWMKIEEFERALLQQFDRKRSPLVWKLSSGVFERAFVVWW